MPQYMCYGCNTTMTGIDFDAVPRVPCPTCGSTSRTRMVTIEELVNPSGSLPVQRKASLSYFHLQSAWIMSFHARELEGTYKGSPWSEIWPDIFTEHRAYVVSSIFASAAFMESRVNEVFADSHDLAASLGSRASAESRAMSKEWEAYTIQNVRARTLEKYQTALRLTNRTQFDKGKQPYQDAALLMKLRNELTHFKPQWIGSANKRHYLDRKTRLFTPNLLAPSDSGTPFFPDKCLGYDCSAWSLHACVTFVEDFIDRMGLQDKYDIFTSRILSEDGSSVAFTQHMTIRKQEES